MSISALSTGRVPSRIIRNWTSAVLLPVILAGACGEAALAQSAESLLKIGDAAPEIKLGKLLQAPSGTATDWKSLKGKIVVLEFWATWCGPCIPAITHLNGLADRFKGQPVEFVAITDENDEALLARFLTQKPIRGWVGVDPDGSLFKSYSVTGRPHTVIVDTHGKIAAITRPQEVTASALADLLADKKISLPLKTPIAEDPSWDRTETAAEGEPLLQVIIKPSPVSGGGFYPTPGRITAEGYPLEGAISAAYQVPLYRLVINLPDSPATKKVYRISIVAPKDHEELLYPLFQQALETAFGIKTRREMREFDAWVLSVPQGKTASLRPSQAKEELAMFARGQFRGQKQSIQKLAELLGNVMYQPVVDETGLKGEYDWELPYNRANNDLLITSVREKLGLELTKAKRQLEVLIVEKAEPKRRN